MIQRINRKLKSKGEILKKARSDLVSCTIGDYFVVDIRTDALTCPQFDLETCERELGVLKQWETLAL